MLNSSVLKTGPIVNTIKILVWNADFIHHQVHYRLSTIYNRELTACSGIVVMLDAGGASACMDES